MKGKKTGGRICLFLNSQDLISFSFRTSFQELEMARNF